MSKKFKRISLRIITFVSVLSILCSFTFFNSAAISNDMLTKSFLGLVYQPSSATTVPLEGVSTWCAYPYINERPDDGITTFSFMPGTGLYPGDASVGDELTIDFSLRFRNLDSNGNPFFFNGQGSLNSNYGSFYANDDYIHLYLEFTTTLYIRTGTRPSFVFTFWDMEAGNNFPKNPTQFTVIPDYFTFNSTQSSGIHYNVIECYIPTAKMRSLNFDFFGFKIVRPSSVSSGGFTLTSNVVILENCDASELPSSVPAPDPDVNQPFDDLESELNGSVDDFLEGDSNGESFNDAINGGNIVTDAVAPSGDPEFFEGDSSLPNNKPGYSFNARDGISFWSEIIRYIVEIPGIYAMFRFALTIGLFSFLFGLAGSIVSKISESNKLKVLPKASKKPKSK